MIRRWSYINQININKEKKFFLIKRFKYKHLKKTTMIKRFHKKYSKTRRKSYTKLKHSTNFFLLHNIFRFWSIDYFFNRYVSKLNYRENYTLNNFLFLNANFIINKNTNIFFTWNFFFLNFSKKILLFFSKLFTKNLLTLNMPFNGSIKSKAWFIDEANQTSLQTNELAFPSYREHENFLFAFNQNLNLNYFQINTIFQIFNFEKILILKKFYKILILTTILNF